MARHGCMIFCLGLAAAAGCATGPFAPNPMPVYPAVTAREVENPLYVAEGPQGYSLVFDRAYDVLQERFTIARSNRFDGTIISHPLVSAGFSEIWRLGHYDTYEGLESAFQSIRRRAEVTITTANDGGYYLDVRVYKELEDLPRPAHSAVGGSVFRYENPIERQSEVVEPTTLSRGWIPIGRDHALEQDILCRLRACL